MAADGPSLKMVKAKNVLLCFCASERKYQISSLKDGSEMPPCISQKSVSV